MSILHWNISGLHSHRNYLRYLWSIYEPQVIHLQETFLVQPPTPIPNYHFIYSHHCTAAASILIHHNTPYTYLNIATTIPCIVVPIFIQRWITIVSIYFSPSHPIDYDNLHNLISQLSSPLMIVLYFNCGHALWGDSVVNSHGRPLECYLSASNLSILNSDCSTHFDIRTQSFSCLDLSICTPPLSLYFHQSVLDQYPFSDHFPILLSPTSYVPTPDSLPLVFEKN